MNSLPFVGSVVGCPWVLNRVLVASLAQSLALAHPAKPFGAVLVTATSLLCPL